MRLHLFRIYQSPNYFNDSKIKSYKKEGFVMGFFDIFRISSIKQENEDLKKQVENLQNRINALGVIEYEQAKDILDKQTQEILENNATIARLRKEIEELTEKDGKLSKSVLSQTRKVARRKELYKSVDYAIENFLNKDVSYSDCKLNSFDARDLDVIAPSVILELHCMSVKDLRAAYRQNEKQIDQLLELYSSRYTTKANKAIYSLMVIALRAELQNILYALKYDKLENAIENVKNVSAKYLKIAGEGNQSIAGTLTKFIGEIEYLFINAVKIEHNYYVRKEQARQEQLAIKEQMRQEAEERKALEAEKKRVEKEETKYRSEISKLEASMAESVSDSEIEKLKARILELQGQLSNVVVKKNEIINLQNGKAGNVYVISNLGSFGEDVFKIGMTRRLDPQDRVNELGSASVPFKFDVHSFIFSDDAVGLENKLHQILNNKRLNKINMRKEFFKVSIDELEKIVTDIDPTAEFKKTMAAEEYRQSLLRDEPFESVEDSSFDDEDDE